MKPQKPTAKDVIALGALVLRFGRVNRATFHEDGVRPETDTDHTVMLGVVACALASKVNADRLRTGSARFDTNAIAAYALVHDLVEAYAGDTQTFGIDTAGRDAKAEREKAAFARLKAEFSTFPWLLNMIHNYELQLDPEARWVRYVDKLLPKITHTLNGGVTLKRLGVSKEQFIEENMKQREKLRAQYPEFPTLDDLMVELGLSVANVMTPTLDNDITGPSHFRMPTTTSTSDVVHSDAQPSLRWEAEDNCWVASFDGLQAHGDTQGEALKELGNVVDFAGGPR